MVLLDLSIPVALGARDGEMPSFERQHGVLVEGTGRIPKRREDTVARGAVGAEGSLMGIVVATRTGAVETAELNGRAMTGGKICLDGPVALAAGDGGVVAVEELAVFAVKVIGKLEGLSSVAALASVTELSEVNVAVTGLAGFPHPLESNRGALPGREGTDLALVALNALDR